MDFHKTIVPLLKIMIVSGLLCSCGSTEKPLDQSSQPASSTSSYVKLSSGQASSIEALPTGDKITIKFSTNSKWAASVSYASTGGWLSLTPSSGNSGENSILVSIKANDSGTKRTGIVKIETAGASVSVSISQDNVSQDPGSQDDGSSIIGANRKEYIGSAGGTISFDYQFKGDVSINIDSDWITQSVTKAMERATAVFDIAANKGGERSGSVVFACGDKRLTLTIIQEAFKPEIRVLQNSYHVTGDGGEIVITVYANVEYESSVNVSWIQEKKSSNPGTHVFDVAGYDGQAERSGVIVFCNDLVGCIPVSVKQTGITKFLKLQEESSVVSNDSGTLDISVMSDISWEVYSDVSWCTANPRGGNGDGKVTLKYTGNEQTISRKASITIKAKDGSIQKTFILYQSTAAQVLDLSSYSKKVGYESGGFSIDISSNTIWDITSDASWCWPYPSNGEQDCSAVIHYEANDSNEARTAEIKFRTRDNSIEKVFKLIQIASPESLVIDLNNYYTGSSSGRYNVVIWSNTSWSVSTDASWCTVSPSSGNGNSSVEISFTENDQSQPRIANLAFKTISGLIEETGVLTQYGLYEQFYLSSYQETVRNDSGTLNISIMSNIVWTVSSDSSWCALSQNEGKGNGTVVLNYTENASTETRSSIVEFKNQSGETLGLFTLKQDAGAPRLEVSPDNINIGYQGGNTSISILSNTEWFISSDASWCSLGTTSSFGDAKVYVAISEQTEIVPRTTAIQIKTIDGSITKVIELYQEKARESLELPFESIELDYCQSSKKILVSSNAPWTASTESQSWCTVNANSTDGSMTITVSENLSGKNRSAKINVVTSAGNLQKVLTVIQKAKSGNEGWLPGGQNAW